MVKVDIVEKTFNFRNNLQERSRTDMIVIHHTGGNDIDAGAEQIHEWHVNNGWAGIGYHFVIRKDGTIERGRPEWAVGSHAYGENSHTLGIHLSGDFQQAVPTAAQVEKCAMLVAYLCEKYGITIDREHIVGHGELMATDCPGVNLQALLDDGTITGKAIWYATDGGEKQTPKTADSDVSTETDRKNGRFCGLDEVPDWAKPTIRKLIDKGLLNGNGEALDLSFDMIRMLVINDRAGVFGE